MKNEYCISDEEISKIITELKEENSNYSYDLIMKAIKGCCEKFKIVKDHDRFIDCVKERARQIFLIEY
jgi:Glu-tRNA(Gln) amidotransferase subunit E-like FAD-binding protein